MNVFQLVGEMTIKGVDKVETTVRSTSAKSKSAFAEMGGAAGKAAGDMESGAGKAKRSVSGIGGSSSGAAAEVSAAMGKVSSAVKGIVSSAQSAASGFASGMGKIGGAAKTAAKAAAGVGASLVALGGGAVALSAASEETVENMGKLENSFAWSGRSIEEANRVYKNFLGLCGDSDQATEAALDMNNLADAGADIDTWYDIASGAVSAFGDALPVENLTESANETVRVGQVAGGLADALNWTSVNAELLNNRLGSEHPEAMAAFNAALEEGLSTEDAMNAALAECSDEQERQQLLTAVLASQYSELGVGYQVTNEKLIASREAQADWNRALAEAGEAVMPFTAAVMEIGASVLNDAMPYVERLSGWMQEKLPLARDAASEALGWIKDNVLPPLGEAFAYLRDEILPPVVQAFEHFRDNVLPPLSDAFLAAKDALAPLVSEGFQWLADNLPVIVPLMAGLVGAFVAYQAALGISALIQAVSTAMDIMRNSASLAAGAQALLNAVMGANPIVLVVSLLAGLVAALVAAYNTNEEFRAIVDGAWSAVQSAVGNAVDSVKGFIDGFVGGVQDAWDKVMGFKDGVVNAFNSLKDGIGGAINSARDTVGGAIDAIKRFFDFDISWPSIPMPHPYISPAGWQIGDLLKGSIPSIGIDWYAKAMDAGMILDGPTVFGFDAASGNLLAGGEAGSETVVGTGSLMRMIEEAVGRGRTDQLLEAILEAILSFASKYDPSMRVVMDTGALVGVVDRELGRIAERRGR